MTTLAPWTEQWPRITSDDREQFWGNLVPAGGYSIENQNLVQFSSCRLQQIRAFGLLLLHQLIMVRLPAV